MNPNFWQEFWQSLSDLWPLFVIQAVVTLAILLPRAMREQKRRNRR